jgi:ureidoglycolate lyase
MKQVIVKELTLRDFAVYGSFADMTSPSGPKLGGGNVEFYRDMALLNLGRDTTAALSVTRVLKRPNIIDTVEMHSNTGEGILPLDGDVLIHVAVATPNGEVPADRIEVFRVPRGTAVTLRRAVWHEAPFALGCDSVNILVVLPERTYADDCLVCKLSPEDMLEII